MLSSLRLRDFRCFPSLTCALPDGVTLFTGSNAQGKTTLLEAVCLLLRLQSPRGSTAAEMIRFGSDRFGIAGTHDARELRYTFGPAGRDLQVDGEPVRKSPDYLAASGLVVWIGNDDRELTAGSGEPRRKFLDFLGAQLQPGYRAELHAYDKALRARNFLLRRDAVPAWPQVEAYSRVLVARGKILTELRRALISQLQEPAAAAHHRISGAVESLTLTYQQGNAEDFAAQLEALRPDESRRRLTLAGPHRDDLRLAIDGRPAAAFASEGQQRTIALALKLAQAHLLRQAKPTGPVILLDDIFGELDPGRRHALLEALPPDAQKLITTTHAAWLPESFRPAAHYIIEAGRLRE